MPDGEIRFRSPGGTETPVAPAPAVLAGEALTALAERLVEDGVAVDPWTGVSTWEGERVDFGVAIEYFA